MEHIILHSLEHSLLDAIRLLPFLFLTYFLMELLEHSAGDKVTGIISRSGKIGPLFGSLLGAVPQCGFSASASGLYSGRIITLGTLFAIFLSTSDEMLPVMISSRIPVKTLVIVLAIKVVIGALVGFAVDFIFRKKDEVKIGSICESEGCHCEKGVLRSALHHTLGVFFFVFAVGFALEIIIASVGEERIAEFVSALPALSNIISATVGLIPNCAASVVITELYVEGVISAGAMISGLLTGAGVGTLVLFKTNKSLKENFAIVFALWCVGALFGIILDLIGFGAIL